MRTLTFVLALLAYGLSGLWILHLLWWVLTNEPCGPLRRIHWAKVWREIAV